MSHRLRGQMTEIFCKDDGCPSQPINKEEKPTLFDELDGYPSQPINKEEKPTLLDELGGIPEPESDDWNEEDKNEEEKVPSKKRRKNFFKNFFQIQGLLPEDDGDKI